MFCFIPEGDNVLLVGLTPFVFWALKSFSLKQQAWSARCVGYKQQGWDKKLVSMAPTGILNYKKKDSLLSLPLFPLQERAGGLQFIEFMSHG